MAKIKFLLVTENLISYIVTTPFEQVSELAAWLEGIRGNTKFANDPIAWLPRGAFANMLVSNDDLEDLESETQHSLLDEYSDELSVCHGTLMVDDNDSVFYWVRDNKNIEEWKLPSMFIKGE